MAAKPEHNPFKQPGHGGPPNHGELLNNIAFLVMDISRLFRVSLDRRISRMGLARSEWWLFAHLCFFEGITQQELADLLDMTKGGLAKLLTRLESKDMIERHGGNQAGRATKRVFFTAKGRPLALRVDKAAKQLVQESESSLHRDQSALLHELLRAVRNALLNTGKNPS